MNMTDPKTGDCWHGLNTMSRSAYSRVRLAYTLIQGWKWSGKR